MMTKKPSGTNESCTSQECACTTTEMQTQKTPMSNLGKGTKTRITVKYNVGFNNTLYLRGKGANLNWEKGIPMRNIKADEWMWETDAAFPSAEFKVLINDKTYETGPNHMLHQGATIQYTPHF